MPKPIFARIVGKSASQGRDQEGRKVRLHSSTGEGRDRVFSGIPNFCTSQPSVCRSISLAAREIRQFASCGLYIATSASATTDAQVTLGLDRPKWRGVGHLDLPG